MDKVQNAREIIICINEKYLTYLIAVLNKQK